MNHDKFTLFKHYINVNHAYKTFFFPFSKQVSSVLKRMKWINLIFYYPSIYALNFTCRGNPALINDVLFVKVAKLIAFAQRRYRGEKFLILISLIIMKILNAFL